MPIIIKRPRPRSDLAEIWNYIAEDNETRADAFVVRVLHGSRDLNAFFNSDD